MEDKAPLSVWQAAAMYKPRTEDIPSKSLFDTLCPSGRLCLRGWNIASLATLGTPETARRGDEKLSQFSWGCRSTLELPSHLISTMSGLGRDVERMADQLDSYDRMVKKNKWDPTKLPSQILSSRLKAEDASVIDKIIPVIEDFGGRFSCLLSAATGSSYPLPPSAGSPTLDSTLKSIRETHEPLLDEFMEKRRCLECHMKELVAFETLLTHRTALDTLRQANAVWSKVREPISEHWTSLDSGAKFLWGSEADAALRSEVGKAVDQDMMHSAVISSLDRGHNNAWATLILKRADVFTKADKNSKEPTATQLINTLHVFHEEAKRDGNKSTTFRIIRRLCETLLSASKQMDKEAGGESGARAPTTETTRCTNEEPSVNDSIGIGFLQVTNTGLMTDAKPALEVCFKNKAEQGILPDWDEVDAAASSSDSDWEEMSIGGNKIAPSCSSPDTEVEGDWAVLV